jgi:hypothetical protein
MPCHKRKCSSVDADEGPIKRSLPNRLLLDTADKVERGFMNRYVFPDGSSTQKSTRWRKTTTGVRHSISLVLLLCATTASSAQPSATPGPQAPARPVESVTVTGTKSHEVIRDFANSFAAHTHLVGKIARWEKGICPITVGMPPEANKFVTERLKEVAAKVGAPVSTDKTCKHNIEVVFTKTPQALLDNVKQNQSNFLGYYDNPEERDRLATVTHPIQAWYTTATQDLNGVTQMDVSRSATSGRGVTLLLPCQLLGDSFHPNAICTRDIPSAIKTNVSGFKTGDGLGSDFYNIIIVANTHEIGNQELDAVSDYVAMLALAQPSSLDNCPPLPSIMTLLAEGCQGHAGHVTDSDMAFLRGLYKMNPEMNVGTQEDEISHRMEQTLIGQ